MVSSSSSGVLMGAGLVDGGRCFQGPAHEFFGVVPDVRGVAFQDDGDDDAPVEGTAGDKAAAGGVGGSGLHAGDVGESLEELVGALDFFGAAVVVSEGELAGPHALAEEGIGIDFSGEDGDVPCGGVLIGFGEAVGVLELGVGHAEGAGSGGHALGECFLAAGDVTGESHGGVVGAFDHDDFEEFATGVLFTGFEVELGGFDAAVGGLDGDDLVEATGFHDEEGGHEFLRAGDGARRVGVFRGEDATGHGIDDDGAFGMDDGWGSFGERGIGKRGWRVGFDEDWFAIGGDRGAVHEREGGEEGQKGRKEAREHGG